MCASLHVTLGPLIIDCVALAKQEDGGYGTVRLFVLSWLNCLTYYQSEKVVSL